MPKTKIVYEVRNNNEARPRWREIERPLPSSVVGVKLRKPGDFWADPLGWDYRMREVEDK